MLAELEASYGTGNPVVADDAGEMTDDERAWGLAPPRDYAAILAETIDRDYRPAVRRARHNHLKSQRLSPTCDIFWDWMDVRTSV